jgi:hypothetical protein|tara:strand:+ start:9705 stop:9866 length:162 start_codon:yes stop_codon:yes gene_type:complete
MTIENLVDSLKGGDNVQAQKDFEGLMSSKMQTALDAKKIDIASQIGKASTEEE